jgi:hypothetical protein
MPGDFAGLGTTPAPPSDHTPLGRRCAFWAASVGGLFRPRVIDPVPACGVEQFDLRMRTAFSE